MNYSYIKNNHEFASFLNKLEDKKLSTLALDTEAELNLHAYGETLCLIQTFDGEDQVLIDPLKIENSLLKSLFENRSILKIIYDATSDLSLMKNAYDIEIKSILDLRPAVALLSYEKQDLHSVITAELGVIIGNKAKFQKHNWMIRPIAKEAIDYALNDVIYLLKLKDNLLKKLNDRQLMDKYILSNLKVQNKDYTRNPEEKYTHINGYQKLHEHEKLIALEIGQIIEKYARLYNIPSHWVINKNSIVDIVKDPDCLDKIHLPNKFSGDSTQSILNELRLATKRNN